MRAAATTFCEVARRMRVLTRATPLAGPRRNSATSGSGLRPVNSAMATTWSAALMGLSTCTVTGTALPFSTNSGMSTCTPPSTGTADPANRASAARSSGLSRKAAVSGGARAEGPAGVEPVGVWACADPAPPQPQAEQAAPAAAMTRVRREGGEAGERQPGSPSGCA